MIKNILQSAVSIENDCSCLYDTTYGYNCTFTKNGDVEGWDVYDNIYLYGCWNKALFGTANTTTCHIGRFENISPVVAEDYPIFRMMIKITAPENPYKDPPKNGKIHWKTSADDSWDDSKSESFEIRSIDSWFLCELTLDDHKYWSSSITALRITIFEGGYEGISFAIRYIRLESSTKYTCLNTQCSYYSKYSHPCKGVGGFSSVIAGTGNEYYTTVSGVSDSLLINIDGYGDECINLGNNLHLSGVDMSKKIAEYINRIDVGSYAYATVSHTEDNKLKITSGNLVATSNVVPLDMGAEFTLYIHAYYASPTFLNAINNKTGLDYFRPMQYLYVIYGDLVSFIELVYGDFLTSNSSYYTTVAPLNELLMEQGFFTDILAIRASEHLNIFSICGAVYSYGPISVIYPQATDVYFSFGAVSSSSQHVTVTDFTNDEVLFDNIYPKGDVFSGSLYTRQVNTLHYANYQTVNYIFINAGEEELPDAKNYTAYGYKDTIHNVEKISSAWLSANFKSAITDESEVVGETIKISGGTAAEVLGFYKNGEPNYTQVGSVQPASGFAMAASRRLRKFEISRLINNDYTSLGYFHNPDQPAVDAGRRDYFESLSSNTVSVSTSVDYYKKLDGEDKIIIDFTHPISDCGHLNNIKIGGSVSKNMDGSVLIFRPNKEGNLILIDSFTISAKDDDSVYSSNVTTSYVSFNVLVSKGDLIGFKNVDLLCPFSSKTKVPNATLCIIPASTNIENYFNPGSLFSKGVIGPSYYAYSDRYQDSVRLDIDIGKRVNVNKFQVYGKEYGDYFEYNLAACLDVDWQCDLFGETHFHTVTHPNGWSYSVEHLNVAYGLDSLSDCSVTADGGQEGTSFDHYEGFATYGPHTYFYVNGDAEWLNGSPNNDYKAEFNPPLAASPSQYYENDPVMLYIRVPEEKSVNLHRAAVYFKESPNFRKMGIARYLGTDSIGGDSEVTGYQYIDNITSVSLDGIKYYPDQDSVFDGEWTTSSFVTTNPLPDSRLTYINGIVSNTELYHIAGNTEWNVFDYSFEPVEAYGFMLYSDWHKSTKIIEIEVYSKFDIKPTLIDNVVVQTSVYGDTWETLLFSDDADNSNLISAFVSASPQYFRLSIAPQDEFDLYELSLSLDDSGEGVVDCKKEVIPHSAKNGELSSISYINVENIYDVPLHLYINIPKNMVNTCNLLSWLKLSSEETTIYGEVGPGAIVHKNKDYPLVSYDNQVAINCPTYYLKNLINNKQAYTYEYDTVWTSFGVLEENTAVNYSNKTNHYVAEFSFKQVASKYWKLLFGDGVSRPLKSIKLLNEGSIVEYNKVYMQCPCGNSSEHKIPVTFDAEGSICDTTVFDYTFIDTSYLDTWVPTFSSGVSILSNSLMGAYPVNMPYDSYGTLTAALPYSSNSFKVVYDFTFLPHSFLLNYAINFYLEDEDHNPILNVYLESTTNSVTLYAESYDPDAENDHPSYSNSSYGSSSTTRAQLATVSGELRLVVQKTSKDLNYIKITDRDETTTFMSLLPERTYFSSRVSNIALRFNNLSDQLIPYLPQRNIYSNIRTVVIDCNGTYGASNLGLRSVDFHDVYGERIPLSYSADFTYQSSSISSQYYYANYVFDTSTSKIDYASYDSWQSRYTYGRVICRFTKAITFSEIVINNYHSSGNDTAMGAKNIKIYVSEDNYTNSDYSAEIPNGILIYDGTLKQHVAENIEDPEYITLSGVGDYITDNTTIQDNIFGVNSVEFYALPYISNFESLIFEFDSVTALDCINVVTTGEPVEQSAVMLADQSDGVYEFWARNSSKFRMVTTTDATFMASGYIRYTYQYRGTGVMYPHLACSIAENNRDVWLDTGQLPLWVAYDFGEGNECQINSLQVKFRGQSYDVLPDMPTTVYFYGSNDTNPDWQLKSKDLLGSYTEVAHDTHLLRELSVVIPYRYYCIYAPNLEASTDEYTLGITYLILYTHLDSAKKDYTVHTIDRNSTSSYSLRHYAQDLYYNTHYYTYAVGGLPHYLIDLKSKQCVTGVKMWLYYTYSFETYGYLEYSQDSTNGLDGSWTTISMLDGWEIVKDSANNIMYYLLMFDAVYASWLRISMKTYTSTIYSGLYEFIPILGEMSSQLVVTNKTYTSYFVVDFGDVYSLDFIRNYGSSGNLLDLFSADIEVSDVLVDNVGDVVWESYIINDNVDARWIKFPLICGNSETTTLQYLGIYPDISKAYKKGGGFNCEWASVGVGLTDYSYSLNVAPQASFYYGDLDILSNVKTIIVDIYSNYGADYVGLTAIELYDENGSLIELSNNMDFIEDNCDTYVSITTNAGSVDQVFSVSNTNVGSSSSNGWLGIKYIEGNVRLSCVLHESVAVSKIAIQNYHSSGSTSSRGIKTTAIWLSSAAITTTTFNSFTSDALLVFYDDVPEHISKDIEDRYVIDLVGFVPPVNNYFGDFTPIKCIQGDPTLVGQENSWGFKEVSGQLYPTLELELDSVHSIKTFKLTHSYNDDDTESFLNTAYRIYGKLEKTSSYTQFFDITANSSAYCEHTLDEPVFLKYIKLELMAYEADDEYYYYDADSGEVFLIEGGFVREFEIWTGEGVTLNSEEHPVVCIDLRESQVVTAHELVTLKDSSMEDITWDNSEEFFSYSDIVSDDPHKVTFQKSTSNTTMYSTSSSYLDYTYTEESIYVAGEVYLPAGSYQFNWESYNATYTDAISINIRGAESVSFTHTNISSGWRSQVNYFSVTISGYYAIYLERNHEYLGMWGARNISIVKYVSNTRWLSVKRDTATNHAWNDDDTYYGIDYINNIRVYAESPYLPTEYPWFWSSIASTISREHMNVKEGRYALKVEYPTSSGVDRLDFLEGDHFGWDENWSVKDTLSFWWYISDIDSLYIEEGGFGFGSFSGGDEVTFVDMYGEDKDIAATQAYYLWDFKDMSLKTGWNKINLQFDKNTLTAPLQTSSGGFLAEELNFRENYFTSFGMVYKGRGESFYMLFDGMKIERNYYNDDVLGDKGLCLTWKEYAEIPLSGITLYTGTIEMWVKPYTLTNGRDIFCNTLSRVLFTLTNNYNNLICLTMKSSGWFEVGFGSARYDFNTLSLDPNEYDLSNFSFDIDVPFHIAVVWSSFGTDMDNSDTLRLYVNNTLMISTQITWEVSDTKSSLLRLGGGSTFLANNNDEEGSAIFSNVKVYDYCKTEFNLNTHVPDNFDMVQGNAPILISKDGVTFYDYNSDALPIKYEEVPPGEKVRVYTRIDKTKKLRSSDSGALEIDWEVIV